MTTDIMTALLVVWSEEELELMGLELFPALLEEVRSSFPGELETTFADLERLPGYLFDDAWVGLFTTTELLQHYRHRLDSGTRRKPRALLGLRCLVVLLFAFDTRMRQLMWARHGVHELLGTHDFDHDSRVRGTACLFVGPVKEHARVFVADILLAQKENDPSIIVRLANDFFDCVLRAWVLGSSRLPWPSPSMLNE